MTFSKTSSSETQINNELDMINQAINSVPQSQYITKRIFKTITVGSFVTYGAEVREKYDVGDAFTDLLYMIE